MTFSPILKTKQSIIAYDMGLSLKRYSTIIRLLVVLFVCVFENTALGQDNNPYVYFRQQLSTVFASLDTANISTGFLRDKAVEIVNLSNYDGTFLCDSNYVDIATYRSLLESLNSSAVSQSHIPQADSVLSRMALYLSNSVIPISVSLFQYNYIRADALSSGCLSYDSITETLSNTYDTLGNLNDPYACSELFAFSPAVNSCYSQSIDFLFSPSLLFKNIGITSIAFNAGDGLGFHAVSLDSFTTITPNYTSCGEYDLVLLVTLNGGRSLLSHSKMIILPDYSGMLFTNEYCDHFKCDEDYTIHSHKSVGQYPLPSAKVHIKYSKSNAERVLSKPLIVAECFDPIKDYTSTTNVHFRYSGAQSVYNYYENNRYVIDSLSRNYDLVYIDWEDCWAPIESNADIVKQVIRLVDTLKVGSNKNILLGESMGGLIARLALCEMEVSGEKHDVMSFISYDTPHLGANVPIGYLYLLQNAFSAFFTVSEQIDSFYSSLGVELHVDLLLELLSRIRSSPAIRQMLYNFVGPNNTINNTTHEVFQSYLANIGFPSGDDGEEIVLIALSNGSYSSPYPDNFHLSWKGYYELKYITTLLFALFGYDSLWNLFLTSSTIDFDLQINPYVSSSCRVFDLSFTYKKHFLWRIDKTIPKSITFDAPASGFPIELATGSSYYLEDVDTNKIDEYLNMLGSGDNTFQLRNQFMFIPTVSSLCLGKGTSAPSSNDYQASYISIDTTLLRRTPFNAVYVSSTNANHIGKDTTMLRWALDVSTFQILGPVRPSEGDIYSLTAGTPNNGRWYSSDPSVLTISDGQIHIVSIGIVTINYLGQYQGKWFEIHKKITVGLLPLFTIHACGPDNNSQFLLTAIPPSSYFGFDPTLVTGRWAIMLPNEPEPPPFWVRPFPPLPTLSFNAIVPHLSTRKIGFKYYYNGTLESLPVYVLLNNEGPIDIDLFVADWGRYFLEDNSEDSIVVDYRKQTEPCSFSVLYKDDEYSFNHYPSKEDICAALISFKSISKQLDNMKPRGENDYMVFPYKLRDNISLEEGWGILKVVYRNDIYED